MACIPSHCVFNCICFSKTVFGLCVSMLADGIVRNVSSEFEMDRNFEACFFSSSLPTPTPVHYHYYYYF